MELKLSKMIPQGTSRCHSGSKEPFGWDSSKERRKRAISCPWGGPRGWAQSAQCCWVGTGRERGAWAGGQQSKQISIWVKSYKQVSFCVTTCVFYGLDVRKAASFLGPFSFLFFLLKKKSFRNRNNFPFKWSLSLSGLKTPSGKDNSPLRGRVASACEKYSPTGMLFWLALSLALQLGDVT